MPIQPAPEHQPEQAWMSQGKADVALTESQHAVLRFGCCRFLEYCPQLPKPMSRHGSQQGFPRGEVPVGRIVRDPRDASRLAQADRRRSVPLDQLGRGLDEGMSEVSVMERFVRVWLAC